MPRSERLHDCTDVTLAWEDYQRIKAHKVILIKQITMQNMSKYYGYGFCKLKEQFKKIHVKDECPKGNICPEIETCKLRHQKICQRMVLYDYCRLGVKCEYKHQLREDFNHKDTSEDIKKIKKS